MSQVPNLVAPRVAEDSATLETSREQLPTTTPPLGLGRPDGHLPQCLRQAVRPSHSRAAPSDAPAIEVICLVYQPRHRTSIGDPARRLSAGIDAGLVLDPFELALQLRRQQRRGGFTRGGTVPSAGRSQYEQRQQSHERNRDEHCDQPEHRWSTYPVRLQAPAPRCSCDAQRQKVPLSTISYRTRASRCQPLTARSTTFVTNS